MKPHVSCREVTACMSIRLSVASNPTTTTLPLANPVRVCVPGFNLCNKKGNLVFYAQTVRKEEEK